MAPRFKLPLGGRPPLLWGAAFFFGGLLALLFALTWWQPLSDPEYGWRLVTLRARIADRAPGLPPVLLLGSSRVAIGLRPGLLAVNRSPAGTGPVVFNFGMCGAYPLMELLFLHRLVADGVRPGCVFVEVHPAFAMLPLESQLAGMPPGRLTLGDLRVVRRYYAGRVPLAPQWQDQLVHWPPYRTDFVRQWVPSWLGVDRNVTGAWKGLDGWGWLSHPQYTNDDGNWEMRAEACGKPIVLECNRFRVGESSWRAYSEILSLCRREKITAVLLALPDPFLPRIEPGARARMDAFLLDLSAEYDAPLVDARNWSPPADLFEGVHLTHSGAAAFTEKFDRDVLQPYLEGEPMPRRWPPGRLNAAPSVR